MICRRCGCTNERACPGGCYWVEPDLCSQCATEEELQKGMPGMVFHDDICHCKEVEADVEVEEPWPTAIQISSEDAALVDTLRRYEGGLVFRPLSEDWLEHLQAEK